MLVNVAVARAVQRLPLLRRLPLPELVILAELAVLAKAHLDRLTPAERRRMLVLLRDARLWPKNLPGKERRELGKLVSKLEPGLFARAAVERVSPLGGLGAGRS